MSEDFEGKIQDMEKKEEENDSEDEDNEEADKEMGETEPGADKLDHQVRYFIFECLCFFSLNMAF